MPALLAAIAVVAAVVIGIAGHRLPSSFAPMSMALQYKEDAVAPTSGSSVGSRLAGLASASCLHRPHA